MNKKYSDLLQKFQCEYNRMAEEIFAGKRERTEEFEKELDVLADFYEKGYERWLNTEKNRKLNCD